jgi:hypothetical protein
MRPILFVLGAVVLVASSCQTTKGFLNPTVAQLEQFKIWADQGHYQQIAASQVSCEATKPGCAQLHWIKADACYRTATGDDPAIVDARTASPQEFPNAERELDCAITNYRAALSASETVPDPDVRRDQVDLGLLESLKRRRDLAESTPDAVRYNTLLREQAVAVESGPIGSPAGYYYAANAKLNETLLLSSEGGCAEIAAAAEDLRMANAEGTPFEQAANFLGRAIVNAQTARKCAP